MGCTGDVGRGKQRLQLMFCCSTRDETRELGLEGNGEGS